MALIDDLKAYWSLDEASGNAIDAHSTHDGTETSGTIGATTGKVSGCRDFEAGDTEYFEVANHADLQTGDIDFTVACWVNAESLSGDTNPVSKWQTVGNLREWRIHFAAATPRFRVTSTGAVTSDVEVVWGSALSTATWYFIVGWHDSVNNQIGISVNAGTPVTASHSAGVFGGAGSLAIGAISTPTQYWDGLIDEVGFWKRVLTSDERTELYNSGNGRDYAYISGGAGMSIPIAMYHYMHRVRKSA